MSNYKAARALGWTSIAIGATEILAARWLQREMGVQGHDTLVRAFGVREIAAGGAILSQIGFKQALANALWARVMGDVIDISMLAAAAPYSRRKDGLSAITALVLAITGLDIVVASRIQQDVRSAARISESARKRVRPTQATPLGAVALERTASNDSH